MAAGAVCRLFELCYYTVLTLLSVWFCIKTLQAVYNSIGQSQRSKSISRSIKITIIGSGFISLLFAIGLSLAVVAELLIVLRLGVNNEVASRKRTMSLWNKLTPITEIRGCIQIYSYDLLLCVCFERMNNIWNGNQAMKLDDQTVLRMRLMIFLLILLHSGVILTGIIMNISLAFICFSASSFFIYAYISCWIAYSFVTKTNQLNDASFSTSMASISRSNHDIDSMDANSEPVVYVDKAAAVETRARSQSKLLLFNPTLRLAIITNVAVISTFILVIATMIDAVVLSYWTFVMRTIIANTDQMINSFALCVLFKQNVGLYNVILGYLHSIILHHYFEN